MTKKEMRINERFVGVLNHLVTNKNTVIVENYNPVYAGAYGHVNSMHMSSKQWYKLAKKLFFANIIDRWNGVWLTPSDIDKDCFEGNPDIIFCFIRKVDVKEVWLKNYVVLKKGGVYSIRENRWYTHRDFYKLRSLYNSKMLDESWAWEYRLFGYSNEEYLDAIEY